jgi:hypothetical protein
MVVGILDSRLSYCADDQFDSAALLVKGFENTSDVEQDDFMEEEEYDMRRNDPRRDTGRSQVTGY